MTFRVWEDGDWGVEAFVFTLAKTLEVRRYSYNSHFRMAWFPVASGA
jgi:hypothetical protein